MNGLIVDNFAGGGGASLGMEWALGRPVSIAVNHDDNAILMHKANHPATRHYLENVWAVDPVEACGGDDVEVAWFSPDCKDFSKAKGGKPVSKKVRGLAWIVLKWAARVRPTVMFLENVEEFKGWGPLTRSGRRIKELQGLTFDKWVDQLRSLGYEVDWRELRACDYGAPTIRKRLFIVARCDGLPIVWPTPSHGKPGSGLTPWRTAAECINFNVPCPSIFERKRPLAEKTCIRIATGIQRYVIDNPNPFIIAVTHSGGGARGHSLDEPVRTITTANRGEMALVTPFLDRQFGKSAGAPVTDPMGTTTAGGGGKTALIAPSMIQLGYGERQGQAPRTLDLFKPLGTVVAGGGKAGLVAAFMAQNNGGMVGHPMVKPVSTIVGRGTTQGLVTSNLIKFRGTSKAAPVTDPLHTISSGGLHHAEVRAFMMKYFGSGGQWSNLQDPLHTNRTKGSMALVTVMVGGEPYVIYDIGMRMLESRELFRAQGFPDDYDIECADENGGKPLTKTVQVEKCGNSVSPDVVDALVSANAPSLNLQRKSA